MQEDIEQSRNNNKRRKEMRLQIKVNEAVGMVDGYVDFKVTVSDTLYSQKRILNSLKMHWDKVSRVWSTSGSIKCDIKYAEGILFDYYSKKLTQEI
jgi:hypothetical protein